MSLFDFGSENSDSVFNNRDQAVLFDDAALNANDKEDSLTVLANCVFLVNATILKERKLLPARLFYKYKVYDDVYGYAVDQKDPDGSKLALKLRACQNAIQNKKIHKLAIAVEKDFDCGALETFIWTFSYDSLTSARASINAGGKHTASFNVDVRDMKETCQQFCKVFSELQEILNQLQPLPPGMVPSLKAAFRSDEPGPDGFRPTDTFVNVDGLSDVGIVSFPQKMKLQLQYHSIFQNNGTQREDSTANDHLLDLEMSDERIEGPRKETRINTINDDVIDYEYDPVYNAPEVIDDASIENHNPESRFEERHRLQSEMVCTRNNAHDSIEDPRMDETMKQVEEVETEQMDEGMKQIEEIEKEQMDVDQDHQEEEEEEVEEQCAPKSPIRFGRVKSVLQSDEAQREHSVVRETSNTEIVAQENAVSTRFGSTRNFAVINQTRKEKTTQETVAASAKQPAKRFGRVASILEPIANIETPPPENTRRVSPRVAEKRVYGRVSSILGLAPQNAEMDSVPADNVIEGLPRQEQANQPEQAIIAAEEETRANRYGRVSSLTSRAAKQSKYGHSSSIRP